MKTFNLLIYTSIGLITSCGVKSENQMDSDIYRGQVMEEDGNVASYESNLEANGDISTTIEVNGKIIQAEFNTKGIKSIEADATITAEDKLILKELFTQMTTSQPEVSHENLRNYTAMITEYISEAPIGHTIPSRIFNTDLTLTNEGVKCIKKGQSIYGQWDTSSGQIRGEWVTTNANYGGNYGCMGRCGAGCGWGAPSAYTKDCMDHDICSKRHNASGGSGDDNCGDEYNQAADDWAQGVARGCTG